MPPQPDHPATATPPGERRRAWLIGSPVRQSLSPAMHNAGFTHLGLNAVYALRETLPADLAAVIAELRAPDSLGANITVPHKQAALPLLDEVSPEVSLVGALNTVVNRDGRLFGDNTDARGLQRWLEEAAVPMAGQDALLTGAGGAARATVIALARGGARSVRVLNRTTERARTLVEDLQPHVGATRLAWGALDEAAAPAEQPSGLVVNATSLGHHGEAPPVHPSWYAPGAVAVELAYNPPETPFMAAARAAGARAENGLGMLVHQALLAFELWTGQTPPAYLFWDAARAKLAADAAAVNRPKEPQTA